MAMFLSKSIRWTATRKNFLAQIIIDGPDEDGDLKQFF